MELETLPDGRLRTLWGAVLPSPLTSLSDFDSWTRNPPQTLFGRITPEFLDNIEVNLVTGCWEWQGRTRQGYGWLYQDGREIGVHQLTMRVAKGITRMDGYIPDHRCRCTCCCYFRHLDAKTVGENTRAGNLDRRHLAQIVDWDIFPQL